MAELTPEQLREYAFYGALGKLQALRKEIQNIYRAFPKMHSYKWNPFPKEFGPGSEPPPVRVKRRMSAAGRKRISEAQKARWARQRKNAK